MSITLWNRTLHPQHASEWYIAVACGSVGQGRRILRGMATKITSTPYSPSDNAVLRVKKWHERGQRPCPAIPGNRGGLRRHLVGSTHAFDAIVAENDSVIVRAESTAVPADLAAALRKEVCLIRIRILRSFQVASCCELRSEFGALLYSKSHRRMDVRLPAKYPRETETTAEVTCLNSFRWSCSTLPKNCFTLCGGTTLVVVNDVHALDASGRHRRRERRPRDRGAIPDCPAVAGARHGPRMAEDEQR